MSFKLPSGRRSLSAPPSWANAAFVVEAMLLLVFLMASFAVFTQMFAKAAEQSREGETLAVAVAAASSVAEQFAADPQAAAGETTFDNMRVVCEVAGDRREGGTLYRAVISVYEEGRADEPVYVVESASYESEVS